MLEKHPASNSSQKRRKKGKGTQSLITGVSLRVNELPLGNTCNTLNHIYCKERAMRLIVIISSYF